MKFKIPENYDLRNIKGFKNRLENAVNSGKFHFIFTGNVGCGKTYLAELIKKHLNTFENYDTREIYKEYLFLLDSEYTDRNEAIKKQGLIMRKENIVLDDIGAEIPATEKAHVYISGLIDDRYKCIKDGKCTASILITNLKSKQLREIYGERTVDRIAEAFIIVKFESHSFRTDNNEIWDANDKEDIVEELFIEEIDEKEQTPEDDEEMVDLHDPKVVQGLKDVLKKDKPQHKPKKYTKEELESDGEITTVEPDPEIEEEYDGLVPF